MASECQCKGAFLALNDVLRDKMEQCAIAAAEKKGIKPGPLRGSSLDPRNMFSDGVKPTEPCPENTWKMVYLRLYTVKLGTKEATPSNITIMIPLWLDMPQDRYYKLLTNDHAVWSGLAGVLSYVEQSMLKDDVSWVGLGGQGDCKKCGIQARFDVKISLVCPESE